MISTVDLVAIILGTGTRGCSAGQLAQTILDEAGGLAELARASPRELWRIPGVGAAQASRLVASFSLGRRAVDASSPESPRVHCAEDVFRRLRTRLCGVLQELFLVVALDTRNRVIDEIEVARGCLTGVEVHPREVFRPLIRQSAASAVLVHNHPSGDPEPSEDDLALTARLEQVGQLVGIPILDHIVIAGARFASIRQLIEATGG